MGRCTRTPRFALEALNLTENKLQELLCFLYPLFDIRVAVRGERNLDVARLAVNCIGNLCAKTSGKGSKNEVADVCQYYTKIFDAIYSCYDKYSQEVYFDCRVSKVRLFLHSLLVQGTKIHFRSLELLSARSK